MRKKHSQYLEDQDKVLLKRERRVIISDGKGQNEEKEKDDNEEEEEYWDYEDGGQTMEELDRLERLDELLSKMKDNGKKKNLFNLWKMKPSNESSINENPIDEQEEKRLSIEKKVPDDSKEISVEDMPSNQPLERDNPREPFIIKDQISEDIIPKPEIQLERINLIDKIIPLQRIDLFRPKYIPRNDINKNKIGFPKMVLYSPVMNPIGFGGLAPIIKKRIEVPTKNNEISYDPDRPNKPIEKDINKPYIPRDQIIEDRKSVV